MALPQHRDSVSVWNATLRRRSWTRRRYIVSWEAQRCVFSWIRAVGPSMLNSSPSNWLQLKILNILYIFWLRYKQYFQSSVFIRILLSHIFNQAFNITFFKKPFSDVFARSHSQQFLQMKVFSLRNDNLSRTWWHRWVKAGAYFFKGVSGWILAIFAGCEAPAHGWARPGGGGRGGQVKSFIAHQSWDVS